MKKVETTTRKKKEIRDHVPIRFKNATGPKNERELILRLNTPERAAHAKWKVGIMKH